ncbi:amino acid adenylation domain-containing protein [Actinophytocola sp.]|uniref:non-ribosomal peptide synthetase n=1 Tax=Actinophytocola sp. TaxID=1872138 RepID=UPI002ED9F3CA
MTASPVHPTIVATRRRPPVYGAWRVRGGLDLDLVRRAADVAAARRGLTRAGQPAVSMSVVELGGGLLGEVVAREFAGGYDLGARPLVRVLVVRGGAAEHLVVVTLHQSVADRRTLGSFVEELAAVHRGPGERWDGGGGGGVDVDPAGAEDGLAFWRERLAGLGPLDFPSDRPRPAVRSGAGVSCAVECGLAGEVAGLAARLGVEAPVVVLAAWTVVLARCSGVRDFAVGVPVPSTANVVPVRVVLDAGVSFGAWVRSVGERVASALAHGRVPVERMVDAVVPEGELFQVFYESVDERPDALLRLGAEVEPVDLETGCAAVDLELTATWRSPGLGLRLTGSADLFDVDTLRQLLDRVPRVLAAGTADPDPAVTRLALMGEAERDLVVNGWNRTTVDYPADRCFHELVERQVTATPDVVAVRCGDRALTYAQLNDRANQLAAELRGLGVGPESLVGIVSTRSVDPVVALLGVLKAGGAYVPLDPAYPPQRLGAIAVDAGVTVVVGTTGPLPPGTCLVPVPGGETGAADLPVVTTPGNLAYVIYTSGSTGQPKGVAVSHRNLVASTAARWTYADPGTDLLTFPLTFDAAAGGLHWMLTKGGTCLMPTEEELHDPRLMARLVREHTITHINTIHSQYRLILEETEPADLRSLEYVDVGGEALPPDLVSMHYRRTPDAILTNCYGPTETTVWAAVCDCRPAHGLAASVPIGRPIPNTRVYLLDEYLAPVAPGVPAELYIGGDGVARGYVGRPGLTAQRFVPDPFGGEPGALLYRTGDRVRYLRDGMIEFLGRVDHQVKIRGFRVELPEIESVIRRHPQVAEVVVTTEEAAPGTRRLVAHVVGTAGAEPARLPDLVREWVAEHLPRFMVPDRIVVLDTMPRTSTGKVDRASFAAPRPKSAPTPGMDRLSGSQLDELLRKLLAERGER